MCFYPRCLWMSTDATLGAGLHSHSHALSLSVSPCVCLHFVSYKNPSSTNVNYHWNTRFDCIRLFSFHKGSTNTKPPLSLLLFSILSLSSVTVFLFFSFPFSYLSLPVVSVLLYLFIPVYPSLSLVSLSLPSLAPLFLVFLMNIWYLQ